MIGTLNKLGKLAVLKPRFLRGFFCFGMSALGHMRQFSDVRDRSVYHPIVAYAE
jgi:hypothetical protein